MIEYFVARVPNVPIMRQTKHATIGAQLAIIAENPIYKKSNNMYFDCKRNKNVVKIDGFLPTPTVGVERFRGCIHCIHDIGTKGSIILP